LKQEPYWSVDYLCDEQRRLGLPLGGAAGDDSDLIVEYPGPDAGCVELIFKVDPAAKIGQIHLYPASPPQRTRVPGYGFPTSLEVEFYSGWDDESQAPDHLIPLSRIEETGLVNPGNNKVTLQADIRHVRGIKLIIGGIPIHEGKAVLAIGEIEFITFGKRTGEIVRATGLPLGEEKRIGSLMDGAAQDRRIIKLWPWLEGLAHRKLLERRLDQAVKTLETVIDRKRHRWVVAGTVAGGTVLVILTCCMVY